MRTITLPFMALQSLSAALQISSLGSSFAAGPDIPTGKNYAQLLTAKINQVQQANISDLSLSASTLLNIGSQIAKIPANTDIVTLTSGGNDLGYVGAFLSSWYPGTGVTEDELLGRFNDVLTKIHEKAPRAHIYLVEYLTLLGPDIKPTVNVPLSEHKITAQREIAATLQRATSKAATGKSWAETVPIAKLSESHGVGSAVPWVNGNKVVGDGMMWHPNSVGMGAVASILFEQIQSSGLLKKEASRL